jgi:hypothetical protein
MLRAVCQLPRFITAYQARFDTPDWTVRAGARWNKIHNTGGSEETLRGVLHLIRISKCLFGLVAL